MHLPASTSRHHCFFPFFCVDFPPNRGNYGDVPPPERELLFLLPHLLFILLPLSSIDDPPLCQTLDKFLLKAISVLS